MEYSLWAFALGLLSAASLPLGSWVGLRFRFTRPQSAVLAAPISVREQVLSGGTGLVASSNATAWSSSGFPSARRSRRRLWQALGGGSVAILAVLFAAGALDDAEFAAAKSAALRSSGDAAAKRRRREIPSCGPKLFVGGRPGYVNDWKY